MKPGSLKGRPVRPEAQGCSGQGRRRARHLWLSLWWLGCFVFMTHGTGHSQTIEELYSAVRDIYRGTFAIQEAQRKSETLQQCIRQLGDVMRDDVQMKVTDRCLYLIGQCHHHLYDLGRDRKDLDAALETYQRLVEQHPNSPLADDAQYLKGVILMTENPQQAFIEFRKVALFFPRGDSRAGANQMMDKLRRESGCKDVKETDIPHQVAVSRGDISSTPAPPKLLISAPEEASNVFRAPEASPGTPPAPAPCPSVSELQRIQAWSGESYTRVALYTSGPVTFEEQASAQSASQQRPAQIVLTLASCVVNPKMDPHLKTTDPFLEGVRATQGDNNTTRVVLDARSLDRYRIFTLTDPHRLIIDVQGTRPPPAAAPAPPSQVAPPVETPRMPSLARQLGLEVKRIVIDPGHGGKDKGAVGPSGVYEKTVTLALALELKKVLESQLGCQVILTRTTDKFVPLEARAAMANANKADLFISIHTNAHQDPKYFGTETYFLDFSKDQESARVAAFENATSTKQISDLEKILHDLLMNTKLKESSQLAKMVQTHVVRKLKVGGQYEDVRDLGVKQAPFWVLLGAEMPCILVETAFITNPREEVRLQDRGFRRLMAEGMASGIGAYIQQMKSVARLGDHS
ncbi:MAG: N-acetylmuramoyl-L-alanine amidase [Syntrophobacteraceae bacterium]|jgi:N-acetylmuramoyl-L-alanine amidase|nr:N-acetylmuramoyl-L-alanine amidase [Syntrophobacteraceae bacterium]